MPYCSIICVYEAAGRFGEAAALMRRARENGDGRTAELRAQARELVAGLEDGHPLGR